MNIENQAKELFDTNILVYDDELGEYTRTNEQRNLFVERIINSKKIKIVNNNDDVPEIIIDDEYEYTIGYEEPSITNNFIEYFLNVFSNLSNIQHFICLWDTDDENEENIINSISLRCPKSLKILEIPDLIEVNSSH